MGSKTKGKAVKKSQLQDRMPTEKEKKEALANMDQVDKDKFNALKDSFEYVEKCLALKYLRDLDVNILNRADITFVKDKKINFEKVLFETSMNELMAFGLKVADIIEETKIEIEK